MDFPEIEKSDILYINKGGGILSMTPYTQTQIRRMIQEWLEWRPTLLFIFNFPAFLCYRIHLPWRADMYTNLAESGHKEINITDIWDAWLYMYLWISPYDHPYGSVDWDSQVPQQWTLLVLLKHFIYPGLHCGSHCAWQIFCCFSLEGWESWGVLVLHPECLDIAGGWWQGSHTLPDCW